VQTIKSRNRFSSLVLVLACGLLLAAPALGAEKASDTSITMWVKSALRRDPLVDADKLSVSTDQGIVTLSGSADNLAARNRADLEAKKILGVRGILNKISVAPAFRSDTDIVHHVRRRILNDAVIESEGIRVSSLGGEVTLRGEVATWSEAEQAALLASEVRGVKKVVNDITSEWPTKRTDQEIKNDAVAALGRDVYLVDLPITVAVEDGVITLTGSVASPFEKDRAARDIRWISHVKSVKNELGVKPWENRGVRKKAPHASGAALRTAVRDELDQDDRVDASEIDVKASYGEVTLEGSVPNHTQKRLAEKDARDVVGVRWVTDNLFAKTDEREDWAIQNDIDFDFDTDFSLEGLDLDANVKKGVVTLSGTVHHWYQKSHAADVAGRVRGVRRVVDEIHVERKTETSRTHSGTAVADEIRSSFKWHWTTHGVADQIDVSVKDSVATLTGNVDTWAQRREAGRVAFGTEGVWKVVNRLTVKGYDYEWENWDYDEPYGDYYYWDSYGHPWG
jgi:osmotically-inducible protein OsmY